MRRLASGGPTAATEAHQMVSEKFAAFGEAQGAVITALVAGKSLDAAVARAYGPYRRRVRANRRRLGPQRSRLHLRPLNVFQMTPIFDSLDAC